RAHLGDDLLGRALDERAVVTREVDGDVAAAADILVLEADARVRNAAQLLDDALLELLRRHVALLARHEREEQPAGADVLRAADELDDFGDLGLAAHD